MIIVFVKDKLRSIDSILPILLECYRKYNQKSLIVIADKQSYDSIKTNVVILDLINYFGSITHLGDRTVNKFIRRIYIIIKIVHFFGYGIFGAKFIHFGHLDLWPYKILALFFRKNVYLTVATPHEHLFENIVLSGDPLTVGKNLGNVDRPRPIGQNFVYFNKNSFIGFHKYSKNLTVYDVGQIRSGKNWIDYMYSNIPHYMSKYHSQIKPKDKIVVFMLGGFYGKIVPGVNDDRTQHRLFEDVLEVLNSCCNYKVLLKPHVFTDVKYVRDSLAKYGSKFEITYLHPALLAIRSDIFICINYSTTMAEGRSCGVTTIEYSKYIPQELEVTKYRSKGYPHIDYFIQNDIDTLRSTIKSLCNNSHSIAQYGHEYEDTSGLIYNLSH